MPVETPVQSPDPSQELDALIEEARQRARRRRLGYTAAIVAALAAVGAGLLIGGGNGSGDNGGSEPAEDPITAVSDAGANTFSTETLDVTLRAEAPNDVVWEATGQIEPGEGRFRLEFTEMPQGERVFPGVVVIGLNGDDNTVGEFNDGLFKAHGQGARCWLHGAWGPVGSVPGTISAEEAMHVTGSTLESLGGEVGKAEATGGGYDVRLTPSASRPRTAALGKHGRVWGDRQFLSRVDGPIAVTSANSEIRQISIPLRDYRPYKFFNNGRLFEGGLKPDPRVARVTIEATLSPGTNPLVLDRPNCHAIA